MDFVLYFIFGTLFCILWGVVTREILYNKGYSDNWFWWGFFFGIFALLVAFSKPQVDKSIAEKEAREKNEQLEKKLLNSGGWKCKKCGKIHPSYTGTCGCGVTKENNKEMKDNVELRPNSDSNFSEIMKYKNLLDNSVITQEEFDAKKKELLNL